MNDPIEPELPHLPMGPVPEMRTVAEQLPDTIARARELGVGQLPILENHDPRSSIGKVTLQGGALIVELLPDHAISMDRFFEVFGNVGFQVLESYERGGVTFVVRAKVFEFSLPPEAK